MTGQRDDDPEVEWLDLGAPSGQTERMPPAPGSRRRRFLAAAGVLVVIAALIVVQQQRAKPPRAAPTPRPPSSAQPTPSIPSPTPIPTPSPSPTPVLVQDLGRPLLAVPASWNLIGRASNDLVRVELAAGLATITQLPDLGSSGPVSLIAAAGETIVRPLDNVPGYVVPDKGPARPLQAPAFNHGLIFPGPDPHHLWVSSSRAIGSVGNSDDGVALVDLTGRPTGPKITGEPFSFTPDGRGYLLLSDIGGVYQAHPDGLRRISGGTVVAVGPKSLVLAECDDQHRCGLVALDRDSGHRTPLGPYESGDSTRGSTSPDGALAAVVRGGESIQLIDLATGTVRTTNANIYENQDSYDGPALIWSPDSKWLFLVDANGQLVAMDRTGATRVLEPSLPTLSQLTLRTG